MPDDLEKLTGCAGLNSRKANNRTASLFARRGILGRESPSIMVGGVGCEFYVNFARQG